MDYAAAKGMSILPVDDFTSIAGKGVEGLVDGQRVLAGNTKLMENRGIQVRFTEKVEEIAHEGKTPILVAVDDEFATVVGIADTLKENSKKAVKVLKEMGIKVAMITGDNEKTAKAIAKKSRNNRSDG